MDEVTERVETVIVKIQGSNVEQVATAKENINSTDDSNDGSIHERILGHIKPKSYNQEAT